MSALHSPYQTLSTNFRNLIGAMQCTSSSTRAMQQHEFYMAKAIRLAEKGRYTTSPNPNVGCVIVKNQQVIGRGWHEAAGKPHAEINALNSTQESVENSTLYVTLEPCIHIGKTPPCVDTIIKAGIKTVVVANQDPNPVVAGKGIQQLRKAGIKVITEVLADEAQQLNPGFFKRMKINKPFVRCKIAMSLDGKTAMASGESQWITGDHARQDVQRLRAQSTAIITGVNTILADNPQFSVRKNLLSFADPDIDIDLICNNQPLRVILDSKARLPLTSRLVQIPNPIAWITADKNNKIDKMPEHITHLQLPSKTGKIDLEQLMHWLGEQAHNDVLVEAGPTLSGSFLNQQLIDELTIYVAPKVLGHAGMPMMKLAIAQLSQSISLTQTKQISIGNDWKLQFSLQKSGFS